MNSTRDHATETVRRRYNRIAPLYDMMEGLMESSAFSGWRKLLWSKVEGKDILEVGVGTGKNFPFYPPDTRVTAIDLSESMLARARRRSQQLGINVELQRMDVQALQFEDDYFDTVIASCVFCSVPDPVLGLKEIRRVLKPNGKLVLLEHVLSDNRALAWWMNLMNPVAVRMGGENINRRTSANVVKSGLMVEQVTNLTSIFRLIEARKKILLV